jgi:diguanylate cyclase (GGDEF)-like protein
MKCLEQVGAFGNEGGDGPHEGNGLDLLHLENERLLAEIAELKSKIVQKDAEINELKQRLIRDSLTGLYTFAYLESEANKYFDLILRRKQAAEEKKEARRKEDFTFEHASVLFVDVDSFKKINDTVGHELADKILIDITDSLTRNVREGDIVARRSGDEIVILLLGADEENAAKVAEKLKKEVDNNILDRYSYNYPALKVTLSIGVAPYSEGVGFREIVDEADKAMYKAKERGKDQVVKLSDFKSEPRI